MRWIVGFIGIIIGIQGNSQVHHIWIGDTSAISQHVWVPGDTVYSPKVGLNTYECIITYYDSSLTKKERWMHRNLRPYDLPLDSSWFRDGRLKSWWHPVSQCANCFNMREWYPSGQLKVQADYISDTCTWIHYYPSGIIEKREKCYQDTAISKGGIHSHYLAEYYDNGQLRYDPIDPNGPRKLITQYYPSGKKSAQSFWALMSPFGEYTEWYESGGVKIKGEYNWPPEDGLHQSSVKIGTWSYYNESGKLIKEEFYEEGKLVKTVDY